MPKIKDLGIKVIPETIRPPEAGGGAGCGIWTCGVSPAAARACWPTQGCSDCTMQQFSICGTSPGGGGCSDCTMIPFSICGTTPCAHFSPQVCHRPFTVCGCTIVRTVGCGGSFACHQSGACGAVSPGCGGSFDPTIVQQPGITLEQIATLKESLRQQIAALDEAEKNLGPKTVAEIDAREKQLNDELAQLKTRRKEIK